MKNRKLIIWEIIGVFVILMLASLWHFVYDWAPNTVFAIIFPVNESPWEHVKLLFFPAIIYYIPMYFYVGKQYKNFIVSHSLVLLLMPMMMFYMFYGYRLGLGIEESLLIDIFITFLSIGFGSYIATRITVSSYEFKSPKVLALLIVIIIMTCNTIFTFKTPHAPVFYDHNIESYGLEPSDIDADHDH